MSLGAAHDHANPDRPGQSAGALLRERAIAFLDKNNLSFSWWDILVAFAQAEVALALTDERSQSAQREAKARAEERLRVRHREAETQLAHLSSDYDETCRVLQQAQARAERAAGALRVIISAWGNRGEQTSLHVWNERMKDAIAEARAALEAHPAGGESTKTSSPKTE